MNMQMPEMDGFEATREIRKEERAYNVRIPIIALTAHTKGGEETTRMMEAGMDEQIEKTSMVKSILETITRIDRLTATKQLDDRSRV